jgi:hypothetical protein
MEIIRLGGRRLISSSNGYRLLLPGQAVSVRYPEFVALSAGSSIRFGASETTYNT